ncbi:hypothetical protein DM02DRAFT_365542 [Periconia macrospinosa]|uniref:Uncharacterized protein n=1 Tax=Periconia macrospinosa TaxID=97972 RepID=A0A2V1DTB8_9PLEO|nr:hypothetical protein DM02DRAFT_365542 [Periconia macrospinosa]
MNHTNWRSPSSKSPYTYISFLFQNSILTLLHPITINPNHKNHVIPRSKGKEKKQRV